MAIDKELLDQLLAGRDPNEVFAKDGLLDDLKKALSERILDAELDQHLEDERAGGAANRRNGHSKKSVLTGTSKMTLSIPRDRAGTFDPKLIAKYQRRFPDFDDKIISMYARGMTVRETRGHLEELYGIDVSPDLISAVTDAVLEEVAEWQNGPLDAVSISAVFPQTVVQTCIVHLIRHSLEFVSWKDRKLVVPALRAIYRAKDAEAGMKALEEFEAGYWGQKYPAITQCWRRNWDHVVPFFAFPESVRRIIYTTNQIEALNSKLRRAVRTRGHFPNDDAAMKLLYLVLNHVAEEWKRPPREWFEGPSSPSSSAKGSSASDETGLRHRIPDSPRLAAGCFNGGQSIMQHGAKDAHHLPVAVFDPGKLAPDAGDAGG